MERRNTDLTLSNIYCKEILLRTTCTQARRQDVAAVGAKNQKKGPKTRRGGHIFKIHYWWYAATGGPNLKCGDTDTK